MRWLPCSAVLALVALVVAPSPAIAGSYEVYACGGPAGAAQNLFHPHSDGLMSAYSICPATGSVGTGIVTKASSNGGRAPLHAGAFQIFEAPPGAGVESITFHVGALRFHHAWTVGLVTYDGDLNTVGAQPYGCYAWGPGCDFGANVFYGPVTVPLAGHRKLRFESRCGDPAGCDVSYSGGVPGNRALFSMANVAVRVRDNSLPGLFPSHGSIWQSSWQRGRAEAWTYLADNVGIMSARLVVDGVTRDRQDYRDGHWPAGVRCDYTQRRPCNDIGNGLGFDTATIGDGRHEMQLEATDAAGNIGRINHVLNVDNSAPSKPEVLLDGGDGWRSKNSFDVSLDPPQGQVSPIVKARYSVCSPGGACEERPHEGPDLSRVSGLRVPEAGNYSLRVWLQDAAGNTSAQHASDPVQLKFDNRSPDGALEAADLEDPLAVNARVFDQDSGVASAAIELRRRGSATWHELGTTVTGSQASARIDDSQLPEGIYDMRMRVVDRAGNDALIDSRRDGSPANLRLPLRVGSRVGATPEPQARAARCTRSKKRRSGSKRRRASKRRKCKRIPTYVTVAEDGSARLKGTLETVEGHALAHSRVEIVEQPRGSDRRLRASRVQTDSNGRFVYRTPAGPSRQIALGYAGTRLVRPAAARLDLKVKARTTVKPSRRLVRNGGGVRFAGRLLGGHLPEHGKLIVLQAHYRRRWRAFATVRSNSKGEWRYRYRFGATFKPVTYRFRALVRFEAAYPFEQAHSRVLKVKVRP